MSGKVLFLLPIDLHDSIILNYKNHYIIRKTRSSYFCYLSMPLTLPYNRKLTYIISLSSLFCFNK